MRWPASLRRRPALTLAVVAAALYLPGFWWGAPHATTSEYVRSWATDDEAPLGPLAQVHNIIQPKEVQNLGYPLMHSFMVTAAYAPYLGWKRVTGELSTPSADYPFGFTNPVGALKVLTGIAHLVSVALAVGIVVATFHIGRILWDERTGVVAAILMMTSFPMFYYGRTGNVDVPMLFFIAWSMVVYAQILTGPFTNRRALVLGAMVGLAVATKEQAVACFLGLTVLIPILHWWRHRGEFGLGTWRYWQAPVIALGASLVAQAIGSGLLVDPERFFAHVEFAGQTVALASAGEIPYMVMYPSTLAGHIALTKLLVGYLVDTMTVPGVVLAAIGVGWVLRKPSVQALFLVPAATYLAILFWATRTGFLRYLLPAAFLLIFFAARAAVLGARHRMPAVRYAAVAAVSVVVGLGVLRGVDLTYEMLRDSRYAAGAWLAETTNADTHLAYFGDRRKLPPLAAHVRTSRPIEFQGRVVPRIDAAAATEIRQIWEADPPDIVLTMPDYTSAAGAPFSGWCPPALYGQLVAGEAGYRLAATFHTRRLFPWLPRPNLDYPNVNPPIRVFVREAATS